MTNIKLKKILSSHKKLRKVEEESNIQNINKI